MIIIIMKIPSGSNSHGFVIFGQVLFIDHGATSPRNSQSSPSCIGTMSVAASTSIYGARNDDSTRGDQEESSQSPNYWSIHIFSLDF